ncbi:DNA repair exonuclease [Clostridium sp. HBUAS56010]|uniref:metallophosphoesterase family protein n=1 Tax=Clostridium sp. HBUAS56010 TaxID=2571127 RepID=UPI0011774D14|nr:DNA repair exonuclease [Clostridium sp. HBUAS56010]
MKFIHIADVHWGMSPDSDKPWSKERCQDIKETFAKAVNQAKDLEADCLLISGDLFHRQPLARDLKEVNYLFSTIPAVHVVIIAGNYDRIRKNSAILSFDWAPNVTYLMSEELDSVYFKEINTEVYGFSYYSAEIFENRLDHIKVPNNGRIHILLGHGGDANHIPFDKGAMANLDFSYIAMGHVHRPEVLIENRMAYAGSLEPLDKTESGQHGMMVGEINEVTRMITSLKFVPLAKLQYISLAVNVTTATTNTELAMKITQEIQSRGPENIFRFRIKGMRDPDISFDLNMLSARFKIMEIVDESEPQYDFSALFAEHSSDMIGFYIQALQKPEMSPVEKKALYYGINALLRTTDERS